MISQHDGTTTPHEGRPQRQQRAERILDAAAELLQRWGYKKTTVDDIAKQARVAKGTIYLHWKTREELFEALLRREWLILAEDFLQRLDDDPEGSVLHNLMKHVISTIISRPLVLAILLRDTALLGDILRTTSELELVHLRGQIATTSLQLLRHKGMLRTDRDLTTQLKMLSAITLGFLIIDHYLPHELTFSLQEKVEAFAETIQSTFEPTEPPSSAAIQEAKLRMQQSFRQALATLQTTVTTDQERGMKPA